ncbi:MAG: hypothetical protein IH606_24205 [Burkholderiales bacterium]|nr:hypothetical protein [Burkholderiales bacterium]
MEIIVSTIASILAIAGLAWAARRLLQLNICPICSGVAGTWLWMLVARHYGVTVDTSMLSALLGGSAVGIAYQLEKRVDGARSQLLWKTLFIPAGFAAAYALVASQWALLAAALLALSLLMAYFLWPHGGETAASAAVRELESKMKNCC